jgi:hypothetical protein
MRISGSRPRLVAYVAPKVVFLGLFSTAPEARQARTLRGDVRIHVFDRERVARAARCSLRLRTPKTCFLLVTATSFCGVGGLSGPVGQCGLVP